MNKIGTMIRRLLWILVATTQTISFYKYGLLHTTNANAPETSQKEPERTNEESMSKPYIKFINETYDLIEKLNNNEATIDYTALNGYNLRYYGLSKGALLDTEYRGETSPAYKGGQIKVDYQYNNSKEEDINIIDLIFSNKIGYNHNADTQWIIDFNFIIDLRITDTNGDVYTDQWICKPEDLAYSYTIPTSNKIKRIEITINGDVDHQIQNGYDIPNFTFLCTSGKDIATSNIKDLYYSANFDLLGVSLNYRYCEAIIREDISQFISTDYIAVIGDRNNIEKELLINQSKPFRVKEYIDNTDGTYTIKFNDMAYDFNEQIITIESKQTLPQAFIAANHNDKIDTYQASTGYGWFYLKNLAEASMQNALSNAQILLFTYNVSNETLYSTVAESLETRIQNFTPLNPADARNDVTVYLGGNLIDQQKCDGVIIIYSDEDAGGNEIRKTNTYLNPQSTTYKNIRTIDYVCKSMDSLELENVSKSIIDFFNCKIYEGKIITTGIPYFEGEEITLKTEYGYIKGYVISASISYENYRNVEDLQILVVEHGVSVDNIMQDSTGVEIQDKNGVPIAAKN